MPACIYDAGIFMQYGQGRRKRINRQNKSDLQLYMVTVDNNGNIKYILLKIYTIGII